MTREFLKGLGIEDTDIISKILDERQKEMTPLKTKIASLEDDVKVKENLIEEKKGKILELEKVDIEALKKEQYELGKTEGSAEVEKFKFDNALESALKESKVRDSKAIAGFIDREKLKYEDGKIVGLDEQITPLRESHDFLFAGEENKPSFSSSTPGTQGTSTGLESFMSVMGIKEK